MKAPRVAPLEGASTYAPTGAYVSMHCGGHDADERRFIALAYIALVRLFLSAAPCKNQEASPQSAQSPKREGGAGDKGRWGAGERLNQGRRYFSVSKLIL